MPWEESPDTLVSVFPCFQKVELFIRQRSLSINQLFQERLSKRSVEAYATIPQGKMDKSRKCGHYSLNTSKYNDVKCIFNVVRRLILRNGTQNSQFPSVSYLLTAIILALSRTNFSFDSPDLLSFAWDCRQERSLSAISLYLYLMTHPVQSDAARLLLNKNGLASTPKDTLVKLRLFSSPLTLNRNLNEICGNLLLDSEELLLLYIPALSCSWWRYHIHLPTSHFSPISSSHSLDASCYICLCLDCV